MDGDPHSLGVGKLGISGNRLFLRYPHRRIVEVYIARHLPRSIPLKVELLRLAAIVPGAVKDISALRL